MPAAFGISPRHTGGVFRERDRRFESCLLQRGVINEPESAPPGRSVQLATAFPSGTGSSNPSPSSGESSANLTFGAEGVIVNLRVGEGRVAAEIAPLHRASVAGDHRLQTLYS